MRITINRRCAAGARSELKWTTICQLAQYSRDSESVCTSNTSTVHMKRFTYT